jgi:hypothetical protein
VCLIELSKEGGEPELHEMMSLELAKQRREELLREAELSRQVKALRAARKGGAGRRSALVWEIKRYAVKPPGALGRSKAEQKGRGQARDETSLS